MGGAKSCIIWLWIILAGFGSLQGDEQFAPSLANLQPRALLYGGDAQKLAIALSLRDWRKVRHLIEHHCPDKLRLDDVAFIAKNEGCHPLARAVIACRKIMEIEHCKHHKLGKLLAVCFFIEMEVFAHGICHDTFFHKKDHDLEWDVEFIAGNHHCYIHLDVFLGSGHKKVVSLSIFYNCVDPCLLARCTCMEVIETEVEMLRKVQGSRGIIELFDVTIVWRDGCLHTTIYTKFYFPGSFSRWIVKDFSFNEKLCMAVDILCGLEAMHSRNICHRDLGPGNFLIEICKHGKHREIKVVISDLGRASHMHKCEGISTQGKSFYRSPESLFKDNLRARDYLHADVFAVGCILFHLFFCEPAPWCDKDFHCKDGGSKEERYADAIHALEKHTRHRFEKLCKKTKLCHKERVELEILRMVHPVPCERGSAHEHRVIFESICLSVCDKDW